MDDKVRFFPWAWDDHPALPGGSPSAVYNFSMITVSPSSAPRIVVLHNGGKMELLPMGEEPDTSNN